MAQLCSSFPSVYQRLDSLETSISRLDDRLEALLGKSLQQQNDLEKKLCLITELTIDLDTLETLGDHHDDAINDTGMKSDEKQTELTHRNLQSLFRSMAASLVKLERANREGGDSICCLERRLANVEERVFSISPDQDILLEKATADELQEEREENCKDTDGTTMQSVSSTTVAKLREDVYELRESIWDVVPFLGHPSLGSLGTVFVLICVLMTFVIIVIFTGIIFEDFSDVGAYDEDARKQLHKWRTHYGHLLDNADPVTGISLVAAVCQTDQSLMTSTPHVNTINALDAYLPGTGAGFIGNVLCGPVLCVLALFVWYCTLAEEVNNIVNLTRALCNMKVEKTITKLDMKGSHIVLRSVGWKSMAFGLFVSLSRLTMCAVIGLAGTSYILHTISMQNLILNCAALQIVLDMDMLIFDVFMPLNSRCMLRNLEPLPMRPWPEAKGLDCWSCSALIGISLVLTFVCWTSLVPFVDDLHETYDLICGGDQNFVVKPDVTGRPWAAPSVPYGTLPPFFHRVVAHAVQETINGKFDEVLDRGQFTWGGYHFGKDSSERVIDDLERLRREGMKTKFNSFYQYSSKFTSEGNNSQYNPAVVHLRHLMRNESVLCDGISKIFAEPSCYQLWGSAVETTLRIQAMCPEGCGCSSVFEGTVYKQMGGCPTRSVGNVPSLNFELASLPCDDPTHHLSNLILQKIRKWMKGPEVQQLCGGPSTPCPDPAYDTFCEVFYNHYHNMHTMLPAICPVRFGCKYGNVSEANLLFCPSTCPFHSSNRNTTT